MDEDDHYEAGYQAGREQGLMLVALTREFLNEYENRARQPRDDLASVLESEGFLEDDTPILEVGAPASPHLAWSLRHHMSASELHIASPNPNDLWLNKNTYGLIKNLERESQSLGEYWHLAGTEPHLLTGKAIILVNNLPGSTQTLEETKYTLSFLLEAQPARAAIYTLTHPAPVGEALRLLGLSYRQLDDIPSADFQPQDGGTLYLLEPKTKACDAAGVDGR